MSATTSHTEELEPLSTAGPAGPPPPGTLEAGWSRQQIEIVPDRYAMSGYGMAGHRAVVARTQLYARALALRDDRGCSTIVCCVDIAMVTNAMRRRAVEVLADALGPAFDPESFVLTCTHTHSSPGGCGFEAMYNWVTPGFVPDHLAAVCDAICRAVLAAVASLAPATITLHEAAFPPEVGVGWNRSLVAHRRNPESVRWKRTEAHRAIDRTMSVLAVRREETVEAIVSLFGVHATCFGNHVGAFDGDNKGRAARQTEEALRQAGAHDPVAVFAQATAGDVSPHYHGPGQTVRRLRTRLAGETRYAERNAAAHREVALAALSDPGTPVTGPIDGVLRYADMSDIDVPARHALGDSGARTSSPCHGAGFFRGTPVDGRGMPVAAAHLTRVVARVVRWWRCRGTGPAASRHRALYAAQDPKAIVLEAADKRVLGLPLARAWAPAALDASAAEAIRQARVGAIDTSALVPSVLPTQVVRIGDLALVCAPGEFTTVAGARLLAAARAASPTGGPNRFLLLTYANDYMGYVTTPEEYERQRYEGGHTVFGRWTLGGFQVVAERVTALLGTPERQRRIDGPTGPPPVPEGELERRSGLPPRGPRPPYDRRAWRRLLRQADLTMRGAWRTEPEGLGWYRCDGREVHLRVRVAVDCEVHDLFESLTDLEKAAKLYWPLRIHHLEDGSDGERFGGGSRRAFRVIPGVRYTERILARDADDRLEWTFERGGPITSHRGTMAFEALGPGQSAVTETIRFSCTWPGIARLLAPVVWHANRRALQRAKVVIESIPDFPALAPDLLLSDP